MKKDYPLSTGIILKRSTPSYPTSNCGNFNPFMTYKVVVFDTVVSAFAKSETIRKQDSQRLQIDKKCSSNQRTSITIFN